MADASASLSSSSAVVEPSASLRPPPLTRAATFLSATDLDSPEDGNEDNMKVSSTSTHNNNSNSGVALANGFPKTPVFGGARKGAKQYQEDSFFYWSSPLNILTIGGIFDGHGGYNGMLASTTARDYALQYFESNKSVAESWSVEQWKERLTALFESMHDAIRQRFLNDSSSSTDGTPTSDRRYVDEKGIVRSSTADPVHGGTTCTLVVMIRHRNGKEVTLVTANVGDSTTLILPSKSKCEFLSVDHGPENSDEFARIDALDSSKYPLKLLLVYDKTNVYRKYECPAVFKADGNRDMNFVNNPWGNGLHPTNVRYEPAVYAVTPRVVSRDSTCIAMTRALGDFYAHQFGLTSIPSICVKHVNLDTERYSVVLASDGIWDCWRYDDFAQFCNTQLHEKNMSLQEMGDATLDESISRAIQNFGAKHYDDACAIVWKIN